MEKNTGSRQPAWAEQIPDEEWAVYLKILRGAKDLGLQFSLGGAFAVAAYSGRWRNTKDLDIYVLPSEREKMIKVTKEAGLQDYYEVLPYDRGWIYRAYQGDNIVDAIWSMANRRAIVDEAWISRGPEITIRGERLAIVPVEEMIWGKIYIIQKTRCDWTDILNMIYYQGEKMDWDHLLDRLGEDLPLLRGVLSVYSWLSPENSLRLPEDLWKKVGLPKPEPAPSADITRERADLMDTRPWFAPVIDR